MKRITKNLKTSRVIQTFITLESSWWVCRRCDGSGRRRIQEASGQSQHQGCTSFWPPEMSYPTAYRELVYSRNSCSWLFNNGTMRKTSMSTYVVVDRRQFSSNIDMVYLLPPGWASRRWLTIVIENFHMAIVQLVQRRRPK